MRFAKGDASRTGVEVVIWDLVFTKQAQKDARKLASSNLRDRPQALLDKSINTFRLISFLV